MTESYVSLAWGDGGHRAGWCCEACTPLTTASEQVRIYLSEPECAAFLRVVLRFSHQEWLQLPQGRNVGEGSLVRPAAGQRHPP